MLRGHPPGERQAGWPPAQGRQFEAVSPHAASRSSTEMAL